MPGPMELLDDVRCFLKSRVILTAAELDVFTCLEEASGGATELGRQIWHRSPGDHQAFGLPHYF